MALTGTTNTAANTAIRYLTQNQAMAGSSLAKLSSGSRSYPTCRNMVGAHIPRERYQAAKSSLPPSRPASSLLQVADGGMARIADILQRMKALAVQAQSGSVTDSERPFLDREFQQLSAQIDATATQTKFNSTVLLDGSAGNQLTSLSTTLATGSVAVVLEGAAAGTGYAVTCDGTDTFTLTKPDSTIDTVQVTWGGSQVVFDGQIEFQNCWCHGQLQQLRHHRRHLERRLRRHRHGLHELPGRCCRCRRDQRRHRRRRAALPLAWAAPSVDTAANAINAGTALDQAIHSLNSYRADMGALMSRFEFASANLATSVENLDAARSTLMDVDVAAEMSKFTSLQVLTQAGVAMLAQANQMPQNLLRLLQN